jgi:DNA-binding CsgD family transcriptional regulator
VLLGRAAERDRLRAMIESCRNGESRVQILRGPAGIGKTALLDYTARMVPAWTVLTTRGVEGEADLPYVNLADLFRPVLPVSLDRIPRRQAYALAGALAIGESGASDRFAVAAATLSLLGLLAEDSRVLILVDDAQWVDGLSLEALGFACRRLRAEGTAVLFAARDDIPVPTLLVGFDELRLGGLDPDSARLLLDGLGDIPAAIANRLIVETGGNPLALLELPALLRHGQLELWSRTGAPVPVGQALATAFGRSIGLLPRSSQDALLLLGVLGSAPADVLAAALRAAGLQPESLDPAEAAGLVVSAGARLEFRHPLIRSVVYQLAPHTRRQRVHRAAAEAFSSATGTTALERYAWHLGTAGHGPDGGLAGRLAAAAGAERARRNHAVAERLYDRAATFAADERTRGSYLVQAADSAWLAGALGAAAALLDRALGCAGGPRLTLEIRYRQCRLGIWSGEPKASRDGLVVLAVEAETVDRGIAAAMLCAATLASIAMGHLQLADELSARALALDGEHTAGPAAGTTAGLRAPGLSVRVLRAFTLILTGDAAGGAELLESCAAQLAAWDPLSSDELTLVGGLCYLALERCGEARSLIERAVVATRAASALGLLPFQLSRLAYVEYLAGNWNASLALAGEALRLAHDTGWQTEVPNSLNALARIEAGVGRVQECRDHATAAIQIGAATGIEPIAAAAHSALGLLELGLGRPDQAVAHLEEVERYGQAAGLGDGVLLPWAADLVEAYVRLGRPDDARRPLAVLVREADRTGRPTAAATAARCQALVDPTDFERHMAEALRQHGVGGMPFEEARTRLCLGEQLRRQGRRAEARRWLHSAQVIFERLGARPWIDRSQAELRASGGGRRATRAPAMDVLTPQELQVALAVAQGDTNRDAAAALFLSVKTVEFHLSNVYRKLGLTRRAQLVSLLAQHRHDEPLRPTTEPAGTPSP